MSFQPHSPPSQTIAAYALLLACMVFTCLAIYSQFFLDGPSGVNPQGDFTQHAGFTKLYYTYTFMLRDAVASLFGVSNYTGLFLLLVCQVCLNILIPFFIMLRTGEPILATAVAIAAYCSFMPVYNLLDGGILFGQISPNIWHNSTFLIAVVPNLAVFLFAVKAIREDVSVSNITILAALSVLSFSAKPSFFSILAPSVLLYAAIFARDRFKNVLLLGFLPCVLFVLFYKFFLPSDLKTAIDPGAVWTLYTTSIPYSVFTSSIFFIGLSLLYKRQYLLRPDILLALICVALGIVQYYLLSEVGERKIHGNFGWAMHQAMNVLLFVSLRFLLTQPRNKKALIAAATVAPHVASGLAYSIGKYLWPLMQFPTVPVFQS